MSKEFEKLQPFLDKAYAYRTALTLISFDNSTTAPKEAIEFTSKAIGILSLESYNTLINPEVKAILEELSAEEAQAELSVNEKAIVKELKKTFRNLEVIPPEEYQAYQMLMAKADHVWEEAQKMEQQRLQEEAIQKAKKEADAYHTNLDTFYMIYRKLPRSLKVVSALFWGKC